MKKARFELLEPLCEYRDPKEVAKIAFKSADESVKAMKEMGFETDFLETVILNDSEYHRKDVC